MKRFCFFLFAAIAFSACKKEPGQVPAGEVEVRVHVKHHDVPIPNARVFVKYNTVNFPGQDTTLYELRQVADGNGFTVFSGLGNARTDYLFYAKGIDPSFDSSGTTPVWGYFPVRIETDPGEDYTRTITIAVSE